MKIENQNGVKAANREMLNDVKELKPKPQFLSQTSSEVVKKFESIIKNESYRLKKMTLEQSKASSEQLLLEEKSIPQGSGDFSGLNRAQMDKILESSNQPNQNQKVKSIPESRKKETLQPLGSVDYADIKKEASSANNVAPELTRSSNFVNEKPEQLRLRPNNEVHSQSVEQNKQVVLESEKEIKKEGKNLLDKVGGQSVLAPSAGDVQTKRQDKTALEQIGLSGQIEQKLGLKDLLLSPSGLYQKVVHHTGASSELQLLASEVIRAVTVAEMAGEKKAVVKFSKTALAGSELEIRLEGKTMKLNFLGQQDAVRQSVDLLSELRTVLIEKFPQYSIEMSAFKDKNQFQDANREGKPGSDDSFVFDEDDNQGENS